MRRIAGQDTVELAPGKLGFRDQHTAAGVPGTEVTAQYLNDVQEEILSVVEGVGLSPDAARDQLYTAIRALASSPYAADIGVQNALVANVNRPGWSLVAGAAIRTKVLHDVVDVATINIRNGAGNLGTYSLVRADGTPLRPYDLRAGEIVELTYDGSNVQIPGGERGNTGNTGDIAIRLAGTSLAAHVPLNGLTIGPSGSGATGRAHGDCRQLYVYLYDHFPDAICPVLTGRGLNAAADWSAGKPIATPDTRCRSLIGVDGMGGAALTGLLTGVPFSLGDAATPGAAGGEARHVVTTDELPPHPHGVSVSGTTGDDSPDHSHTERKPNESNTENYHGEAWGYKANLGGNNAQTGGASQRHQHPVALSGATDDGPGASEPHNNMPPFVAVVMFARL